MNIEKLPSGNYRVTKQIDGKRYRLTFDHKPTRKEADDAVRAMQEKAHTLSAKDMTFRCAFESYLDLKANVISPSTIRSYRTTLKQMSDEFVEMNINDIEPITVQCEINTLSARLAPKSIRNIHGLISAVLAMFRPGLILRTTLPQPKRKEFYLPTQENIKDILAGVKDTRYYVPFVLGILGMRRSEILAVTDKDLDGNKLTIASAMVLNDKNELVTKGTKTTNSTRIIYLPDEIAQQIKEQGCAYNGQPVSLWRRLKQEQDKRGIPHFRFHDLRAYYASYAHMMGIPDQMIQEGGGWKTDYTMKRVYRRTMQDEYKENQKKYLDNLGELL